MNYANSMDMLVDGEVQTVPILDTTKASAIIETASGETVSIQDSAVAPFSGLKLFGKATQDGTPSPESPVPIEIAGSGGAVNVNITGNQLFDASKLPTKSAGGATVTNNGDGSFTIRGNGSASTNVDVYYTDYSLIGFLKPGKITLNTNGQSTEPHFYVQFMSNSGGTIFTLNEYGNSYNLSQTELNEISKILIGFYCSANANIAQGTVEPILYQDGDGTWEPFQTPQQLPLSTPNGLPGIPVTSGGNYTDATGQQWISDVIDLEAGTYTQNVKKFVFDSVNSNVTQNSGSTGALDRFGFKTGAVMKTLAGISNQQQTVDTWGTAEYSIGFGDGTSQTAFARFGENINSLELLNSHLQEHPFIFLVAIQSPVVTQLSSEEIAAYKALLSNYPSTNIFTDSTPQAGIEASYTADTKTYIDNKISQAVAIAKA